MRIAVFLSLVMVCSLFAMKADAYQWDPPYDLTPAGDTAEYSQVLNGARGQTLLLWRTTDPGRSFLTRLSSGHEPETRPLPLPSGNISGQNWLHAVADIGLENIAVVTERTLANESALWVVRSTDGGQNWSAARRVGGSGAATPIGAPNARLVASADLQTLAAGWIGTDGTRETAFVSVSTDAGATWAAVNAVSDPSRAARHIALVMHPTSGRLAYGVSYWDAGSEVVVSDDSGVVWSSRLALPDGMSLSALELDPRTGALLALGVEAVQGSSGSLQLIRSEDGGDSWTESSPLAAVQTDRSFPDARLSMAAEGGVLLATWVELVNSTQNADFVGRISIDGGKSWGGLIRFSGSGRVSTYHLQPEPAISRSGQDIIVGWFERAAKSGAHLITRSSGDAGAQWRAPKIHASAGNSPFEAKLAQDLAGPRQRAVWHDAEEMSWTALRTSSTSADGLEWGEVRSISGPAVAAYRPALQRLRDGVMVATWLRRREQRWILEASRSIDEGRTWESPVQLGDESINSGSVELIGSDRLEAAVARWWTDDNTYGMRRTRDGGVTWEHLNLGPLPEGAGVVDLDMSRNAGSLHLVWAMQDGTRSQLWSARSYDLGDSWTAPVRLGEGVRGMQSVSADGSRLHLIHSDRDRFPGKELLRITSSMDGGATWGPSQQLSGDHAPNAWNLVASADGLNVSAGWQEFRDGQQHYVIRASTDGGLHWQAPVDYPGSVQSTFAFTLIGSRTGRRVVAVWKSYRTLHVARTEDSGLTWSGPEVHFVSPGGSGGWSAIAASEDARMLTFLSSGEPRGAWVTASLNAGRDWIPQRQLVSGDTATSWFSLSVSPAGDRGAAIWIGQRDSGAPFVQTSTGAGLFDAVFSSGFEPEETPEKLHVPSAASPR